MRRLAVVLVPVLLAAGCGGEHPRSAAMPGAAHAGATAAAVRASNSLTLTQAIGQHFVFAYAGLRPPRALERRIARGEAAGVILFARNIRNVAQVRATVRRLQRLPRPRGLRAPLLVLVDQEGGPVRRLPGPPRSAAAESRDPRADGRAAARLLGAAGVNVDLAPVVDVARPGGAMARERRGYGSSAEVVIARAGAFVAGLRAGGVAPVLKHFPGFGAAMVNTDDGVARIELPLDTLRRIDIAPYAALHPGAVLLSTAIYPRVDPRPAAFSPRWVKDELRERLDFEGVAITDDLQAPAVARFGSFAQLAYYALDAGADLPLFAKSYTAGARAAAGLVRAVHDGALSRATLDAGAQRVLAWRASLASGS